MKIINKKIAGLSVIVFIGLSAFAQNNKVSVKAAEVEKTAPKKSAVEKSSVEKSSVEKPAHEKTTATFKDSKIINAQTTETVKKGMMDFVISHRFGSIGVASNGGKHTLYGLDVVTDIRLGFDFGVTDKLTIGIGRSKQSEFADGWLKYRILSQTDDNHIPLSLAIYGDGAYNAQLPTQFFSEAQGNIDFKQKAEYRFSYIGQLIIARKFGWRFSMELVPTYQHRNFVMGNINPNNGAKETNDLLSVGGGARLKLTQRFAIIADYFYTISDFRMNNTNKAFYNPLGLGVEIDTGLHTFHITFTNSSGIIENSFIPNTIDSWLKGGFKLGFSISRGFSLSHKKK